MGKETWLLLSHIPEWRWGINKIDTFWYPSIKLFRQTKKGNWNELMKNVASQLRDRY
tara:strand:+ start:191 stop:361 length:171 start_codon:yes stop_codon:yes gene_type:complete